MFATPPAGSWHNAPGETSADIFASNTKTMSTRVQQQPCSGNPSARLPMAHPLPADCEEFSDGGFPTLPRPKAILSLARRGHRWSVDEASLLQTFPVRIRPTTKRKVVGCSGGSSVVSNGGRFMVKQTVNGKSCFPLTTDVASSAEREPPKLLKKSWRNSTAIATTKITRCASTTDAERETEEMSFKGKRSKRPMRSLTFSFGSNSDKKRRSLGFFSSPRRQSDDSDSTDSSSVLTSSPILVARQKSKTLPATTTSNSSSAGTREHHCIIEERASNSSTEDWTLESFPNGSSTPPKPGRKQFSSCRDLIEGEDIKPVRFLKMKSDPSPVDNRRERLDLVEDTQRNLRPDDSDPYSLKGPSLSAAPSSSPSSQHVSPIARRRSLHPGGHGLLDRKFSDPAPGSETDIPLGSSIRDKVNLKKRYSFCVRPSRDPDSPRPGWREMRVYVVRFLLETEQSYVQSLKTIIKVYFEPLRRPQAAMLADPSLVHDIFYQIPEICSLHEKFLQHVSARVDKWSTEQKIGDVFVNTFSKCQLLTIYSKFIGNFMRAKAAVEIAKQARPVFAKFLEQRAKDSEGKLALDDLLIKPVQRIPRYVLFIKDLLKHTAVSHPDHSSLQQALGELTMLAERVNASEKERGRIEQQKELMIAVDGLALLLKSQSRFVRYDMVTEIKGQLQKRDRFLVLFSDLVVCASTRRKSTGFIRSSLLNLNSALPESLKYRIKWHVPLVEMSIAQVQAPSFQKRRQNTLEKLLDNARKDEATLQQMLELSATVHRPHQTLVSSLKDMLAEVRDNIAEKRAELDDLPLEAARIDLVSYASSPPSQYSLVFPSQRIRNAWEREFLQAKADADHMAPPTATVAPPMSPPPGEVGVSRDLEFLHPIILNSGGVGTQLTCATVGLPVCDSPSCLWVCSSDGFVGQVSLLNLHAARKPQTVANITVAESRITAIAAVPVLPSPAAVRINLRHHRNEDEQEEEEEEFTLCLPPQLNVVSASTSSRSSISCSDLSRGSGSFSDSEGGVSGDESCTAAASSLPPRTNGIVKSASTCNGGLPMADSRAPSDVFLEPSSDSLSAGFHRVRSNSAPPGPPLLINQSASTPEDESSEFIEARIWSPLTLRPSTLEEVGVSLGSCDHRMWLGTERGELHIYSSGNNLRSRSNRQTVQLSSAIHCIHYHEGRVYVGLADGSLAVFNSSETTVMAPRYSVAVSSVPVTVCVAVEDTAGGGVWLGSGGALYELDTSSRTAQRLVTLPSDQVIHKAVAIGNSVWVSVKDSPVIHLCHAPSGHMITSVDCTRPVMDMLRGYNPIIRQHKSSSLRVTALTATPTHLLVGTSAGAVLTLPNMVLPSEPRPLPHPPFPSYLAQGHVDPAHFLACMSKGESSLVVSGGNGFEDFVSAETSNEIPETSSCLLIWRTPDNDVSSHQGETPS